ncbi:MAG: hypothetical protein IKU25_03365, partial [Clostridia bacterium]|nr:hypothetical protein [Clostridia bacterium]
AMARTNIAVVEEYAAPHDLTYSFIKPAVQGSDKKMYNQAYVESLILGSNTAGGHGELNKNVASAPWGFYDSNTTGGNSYVKYNNNNADYGIAMYVKDNYSRYLLIVDNDGMYTPTMKINGGNTKIGFSLYSYDPATDTIGSKEYIKATGLNAGGSVKTVALSDAPVALKKGMYVLKFEIGETNYAYMNTLNLKYEGEITAELFASAPATASVEVGKTVDVPVALVMGDESAIDYSKVSFETTTFDTADVATATETVDGSAKVTFTGVAVGTTNATITLKYGENITKTLKVAVTVVPDKADVITASTSAGVITVNAGESAIAPITVVDGNGEAVDASKLSATIAFNPENIATAAVDTTSGFGVKFTGVAEGTTTAIIAVTNGKSTSNVSVNVKVNPEGYVEVRDYFYNFKKGYTGDTSLQSVQKVTYAMTEAGSDSEVNKSIVSDPWAYYNDDSAAQNDGNNYFKYNGNGYGPCKSRKNFGALKIKVPATGTYVPFALMYKGTNVLTTVKLSKVGENGKIGDAIATSEFAAGAITETKDYQIGTEPVYLEAGEYVVSIHNSVTNGLSIIDGFRLVNDATLLRATASVEKVDVVKGATADVKITVKDNKGNVVPASSLTTTVSGLNESLATAAVGADGDDVKVTFTGVALGNTEAKVSFATADGKKGDIKIAVETLANFGLDITLDIPDKLAVGTSNDYTVVAKRAAVGSSESSDAAVTVTATSSNSNILKATVTAGEGNINNKIKLEGLVAGAAAITVKVVCEDVTKTYQIPILVTSTTKNTTKNYKYLYHKNLPYGGDGWSITQADSFMDTLPGTALRAGDTDNWRFAGISENSVFYRKYDTYGGALEMGTGIWTSMEVRLPQSGTYEIVGEATEYTMAGIYRIYVAPKGAENPRDPKWSVGSHDCYYGESKDYTVPQIKASLRTIELEAGDYIVTWENVGKNGASDVASPRLYPDGVYFNAKSALPQLTITPATTSTTLPKYTKALVLLEGALADGTVDDLYGMQLDITATNENIASVKPY